MYIITWRDGRVYELVGDVANVLALAALLEDRKIKFKISSRNGFIDQESFGCSGYEFWVKIF